MDTVLIIICVICLISGFLGCIIPFLPGPPISWIGLLLLKFTDKYSDQISWRWIVIWGISVFFTLILDYIIPIWGTKKMGGSKPGVWGATIGTFVGLLFLPWGIILGPFFGALVGEWLNGTKGNSSLKAAFGSFIGFLLSTGLKLLVCGLITYSFISAIMK